jgi:hypothetical protein
MKVESLLAGQQMQKTRTGILWHIWDIYFKVLNSCYAGILSRQYQSDSTSECLRGKFFLFKAYAELQLLYGENNIIVYSWK